MPSRAESPDVPPKCDARRSDGSIGRPLQRNDNERSWEPRSLEESWPGRRQGPRAGRAPTFAGCDQGSCNCCDGSGLGGGAQERQHMKVLTGIELEDVGDERQQRLRPLAAKVTFERPYPPEVMALRLH